MKEYYDTRAPEYDEWYEGTGRFAERDRPAWRELLGELADTIRALPPARTLDVACGTGYATTWLPGEITGLDQSASMLAIAQERLAAGALRAGRRARAAVRGRQLRPRRHDELLRPPGGLDDRERFLAEARRVAPELVVVDAALREDTEPEEQQERILNDGSSWTVYKRYFTAAGLAEELGGGETVYDGRWFVVVRSPR